MCLANRREENNCYVCERKQVIGHTITFTQLRLKATKIK